MAYMVWARYTKAVLDAYRGSADAAEGLSRASAHRQWLESLRISEDVKDELVESAKAIEEAFEVAVASQTN
jgi:hypothetical protein